MRCWIVTAQRLSDGRVVYLGADREWATRDAEAERAEAAAALEPSLQWARGQTEAVVEPYAIEVEVQNDCVRHLSIRERIRAEGPDAVLARLGLGELSRRHEVPFPMLRTDPLPERDAAAPRLGAARASEPTSVAAPQQPIAE
jgi:hypothetical protein